MKKLVIVVTLLIVNLVSIIVVEINTSYAVTGITNTETVRIRKEPDSSSTILDLIAIYTEVEIIEQTGNWYKIEYEGITGYVRADLIDATENVTASEENNISTNEQESITNSENTVSVDAEDNTVTEETISETSENTITSEQETTVTAIEEGNIITVNKNIYVKILPSINSTNISEITSGTQIEIIEVINKWCYIQSENIEGWVRIANLG